MLVSDERADTRAAVHLPVVSLACRPVLAIAAGVGLVLLLTSGRVGYFCDELYFLVAGHRGDVRNGDGRRWPPLMLMTAGVGVGMVLFCYGLWRLLRSPELRPYRFLGWTFVGLVVFFLATNGRFYYVAEIFRGCHTGLALLRPADTVVTAVAPAASPVTASLAS